MSVSYKKASLVLAAGLLSLLLVHGANAANPTPQHAVRKRPVKQEQPAPPPALPPAPPTPEQLPAQPPKVTFSNGQLTIVAENSTLGDILRAVRAQTRTAIEIPPNATERVVTHIGPATVSDVLTSLLNGSHFNYVMLGSPTHPGMVDRLILTSATGGGEVSPAPMPVAQNPAAPAANGEEDTAPVEMSDQPAEDATDDSANNEQGPQPAGPQQQVKTPEQLLRELQQMQQQQQQQGGATPDRQGQPPAKPE